MKKQLKTDELSGKIVINEIWTKYNEKDVKSMQEGNDKNMQKSFLETYVVVESGRWIEKPVVYIRHENGLYLPCVLSANGKTEKAVQFSQIGRGLTPAEYGTSLCQQFEKEKKNNQVKKILGAIENDKAEKKNAENATNKAKSIAKKDSTKLL